MLIIIRIHCACRNIMICMRTQKKNRFILVHDEMSNIHTYKCLPIKNSNSKFGAGVEKVPKIDHVPFLVS